MAISNLTIDNFDRIYGFLEEKDQKALGLCCRCFEKIHSVNQKYISIAQFIEKNYLILATNLSTWSDMPLWYNLQCVSAILMGEWHNNPEHRKKNAALTEMIWKVWEKAIWSFLIEGISKQIPGMGMLRYLSDEIAQTHERWEETNEELGKIFGMGVSQITLISEFLKLRDENDPIHAVAKLEELIKAFATYKLSYVSGEELEQKMQKAFSCVLDDIRHELPLIQTSEAYRVKFKFHMLVATFLIGQKMNDVVFQSDQAVNSLMENHRLSRDDQLADSVIQEVDSGKKAVVWAGEFHVIPRVESPLEILHEEEIPFISVMPRSDKKIISQLNSLSDSEEELSPREQLKAFNTEPGSIVEMDELYTLMDLNLYQIFAEELGACLKELTDLNDFMQRNSDIDYPKSSQ